MPYSIVSDHPDCEGFAVVKDEDNEILGCHRTKAQAEEQLTAINIAEFGKRALPQNYRPASSEDVPDGRNCANCYFYEAGYCNLWDANVKANYYCNRWAVQNEDRADPAAPAKDQISGSDKNKPGSAAGKGGDISINAGTEKALQTKALEHNEAMTKGARPNWTRVRLGSLKSVYRRGSGAYSTSHRPGIGRAQWSMARVNAFLVLARTGRPKNPKYVGDNDLLHSDHPRYSKQKKEGRAVTFSPNAGMKKEAAQSLDWREEFGRGGTEIGLGRARDIVAGRDYSLEMVNRTVSFFARHEVDKQAEGFSPGEDGYPSNGRIAWGLWGGDAGKSWAENIVNEDRNYDDDEEDDKPRYKTAALLLQALKKQI